jgi:hypothetical protein
MLLCMMESRELDRQADGHAIRAVDFLELQRHGTRHREFLVL